MQMDHTTMWNATAPGLDFSFSDDMTAMAAAVVTVAGAAAIGWCIGRVF